MDQGRTVKAVFESKLDVSRRPRLGWLEYVKKDLREMKVMRQWQNAADREERAPIITEAKDLRGMQFWEWVSEYVIIPSQNMLNLLAPELFF